MNKKHIVTREPCQAAGDFEAGTPPLLQRIYLQRGITQQTELKKELSGLPSPNLLKGINEAVDLLVKALHNKQKITVVGDFDTDGATSSALAIHVLRAMGFCVDYLVPNRFEYGYGLTPEIVDEAIRLQNPDLIITVDNGISSWQGVKHAQAKNIQVIVTDHHLPGKTLPSADAIVNPNQAGCKFPTKNLAGVGVIFYVMSALRAKLREEGYFKNPSENLSKKNHAANITEPNMADYLDLVAMGTVADVVPLDFVNRILVQQGLLRIRAGKTRPGITALIELTKRNAARLVAADFGFALAPRLNAAGRMDDISTGIQCLLCEDLNEAKLLAAELEDLNKDRKTVEASMQQEALQAVEKLQLNEEGLPWGLCVFDDSWHQGVVGLLASRLKERYHRPVIAFAPSGQQDEQGNNILKGSGRSIEGLHIRDALDAIATNQPGLIDKFGGHAMAAGLSLPQPQLQDFMQAFDEQVRHLLDDNEDVLQANIVSDGELQANDFNQPLAQQLRSSEPWGQHFPAPLFHGQFTVMHKRLIGTQHLKLVLQTKEKQSPLLDAIVFFIDEDLKESVHENDTVLIAYRLDINEFRGEENLQLMIEYIEPI